MKTNSHSLKKIAFATLAILLACALILGILEKMHVTHLLHKEPAALKVTSKTPTAGGASSSNQKGETKSNKQSDPLTTNQPGDEKSNAGNGPTVTVLVPTGDFVSNHHPNLSGSPAPNVMTSVCTTSPGTQCSITFTKGATTKSLPAQTTDREGSTYWNWKLQDIGLTQGTWEIKAVASFGSQTKTANDAINLEVKQ